MTIHVFHGKSFRDSTLAEMKGKAAIHQLILADGYHRVAAVEADDLEKAYELTNNIDRPWPENEGVEAIGGRFRSTSVGDLMLMGEDFYVVAGIGFEKIGKVPVGAIQDAAE